MKTREIIILLLAAAFGAIAIVTWNGEEEAKALTAKAVAARAVAMGAGS